MRTLCAIGVPLLSPWRPQSQSSGRSRVRGSCLLCWMDGTPHPPWATGRSCVRVVKSSSCPFPRVRPAFRADPPRAFCHMPLRHLFRCTLHSEGVGMCLPRGHATLHAPASTLESDEVAGPHARRASTWASCTWRPANNAPGSGPSRLSCPPCPSPRPSGGVPDTLEHCWTNHISNEVVVFCSVLCFLRMYLA